MEAGQGQLIIARHCRILATGSTDPLRLLNPQVLIETRQAGRLDPLQELFSIASRRPVNYRFHDKPPVFSFFAGCFWIPQPHPLAELLQFYFRLLPIWKEGVF
jgi:hypothetical protein